MRVALLYGFFALFLNRSRRRRRMNRLLPQKMIMCCLRVSEGDAAGLDGKWRDVEVRLAPGKMFLPAPDGGETQLAVRQISSGHPRRPRLRELIGRMDTDYRVVGVRTDDAALEWAVPEQWLTWAVAQVLT